MLRKLWVLVAALFLMTGVAAAQVDVNKADQIALDGVKGVGPKTSKMILDERAKGGAFKDWADLEARVKGIGEKSAVKLSVAGLTVNGQPRPPGVTDGKESGKAKTAKANDVKTADAGAPAAKSAPNK